MGGSGSVPAHAGLAVTPEGRPPGPFAMDASHGEGPEDGGHRWIDGPPQAREVTVIPPGRATDAEPLSVLTVSATGTGPRKTAANPRTGRSRPRSVRRRGRPTPCSPPPCRTGTAGAGQWGPGSARRVGDADRGRR